MASLPQMIGRYHVLGELATGGMAEILLGRLEGPSGFQRPVVIKRILPHLARQPEFLSMFLDEGRIVAGIRHQNVVTVHELSKTDDELFLVMEYLEGEPVSGLMKRLQATGTTMPLRLSAHVVAEVCAGLHAAHELEDDQGVKQELVHRDVSPQNVVVTYDGHVKLLDFGVARAADRVTRTEVGQVKGKLTYMSPEQCAGEPLDRRSDIFALGVVLYELTTGRLLFKRSSAAATVRAICDEPVLPPSRLVFDYPRALEEVCLRALSRARDDRYASALEMRAALFEATRTLDGEEAELALGKLMRTLFADRVIEKRELLRRVRVGTPVEAIPAGEVDSGVELATVADSRSPARPVARRRVWPAVLAGGLLVASAGAVWMQQPPRVVPAPVVVAAPIAIAAPATPPAVVQPILPSPHAPVATPSHTARHHAQPVAHKPAAHPEPEDFHRFE